MQFPMSSRFLQSIIYFITDSWDHLNFLLRFILRLCQRTSFCRFRERRNSEEKRRVRFAQMAKHEADLNTSMIGIFVVEPGDYDADGICLNFKLKSFLSSFFFKNHRPHSFIKKYFI